MKALSIRQPWAWLIVAGHKPIENRTWTTNLSGDLLIHASKTFEHGARESVLEHFPHLRAVIPSSFDMGGLVGVARLVDVVTASTSPWFRGPFGLVLRGARPLGFTPLRGEQGLFNVDDDLAQALLGRQQATPAEAEAAGQQRLIG